MRRKILTLLILFFSSFLFVYSQSIKILSPRAGAILFKGNTYTITWTKTGTMNANVKIRLMQNGKKVMGITDSTPNDGSHPWTVPTNLTPGTYYIRVKTIDNAVYDDGEKFTIADAPSKKASITVTSPHSGDTWSKGKTYIIKWTKSGSMNPNVKIRLIQGGTKILSITNSTPNNGSYSWTVPDGLPTGNYQIRVKTVDNAVYNDSDKFKIEEPSAEPKPYIERISPVNVRVGDEIEIFGKNFYSQNDHYVVCGDGHYSVTLKDLEWKKNYIKITTKNTALKAGNKYALKIRKFRGEDALTEKTDSNRVYFKVVEPEEESCMLKIVRAGLFKNRIKEGEEVKYFIVVRNESNKDFKGDIFGRISLTSTSKKYRNGLEIKQNIILEEGQEKQINLSFRSDSMKDFTAGVYFAEFFIVYKVDSSLECKNKYKGKSQLIIEEKKEDFDLTAYNCGYKKDVFTKGETGDFVVTVTNKGPSTVKKYKIIAWSVRGNGKSLVSIRGNTGQTFQRDRELKANESIMEGFKLRIKDSPGDYTLFIKVESVEPESNKEKNKTNNTCKMNYKVLYKTNTTSISRPITLNFPDLTFDSKRTKIGANGIEAVIKNLNYKKAKLPFPKTKEIFVKIENISSTKFQRNILEFPLPVSVITELNKTGETDYISRLGIRFPAARITIDSKNSILETNENNNTIAVE